MFSDLPSPDAALHDRRPSIWTPERARRAMRLYLVEGFTAADVADALGPGFSRAAVIGKMRRLGCLKREVRATPADSCAAKPNRRLPRAASARTATRLPPQRPPQPLPPLREIGAVGSPATLACLPAGACRWPIDDPGAGRMHLARFCGGPATAGVYCAAHRALAVRRPA
jgi:GcrA cell cycle regulator